MQLFEQTSNLFNIAHRCIIRKLRHLHIKKDEMIWHKDKSTETLNIHTIWHLRHSIFWYQVTIDLFFFYGCHVNPGGTHTTSITFSFCQYSCTIIKRLSSFYTKIHDFGNCKPTLIFNFALYPFKSILWLFNFEIF